MDSIRNIAIIAHVDHGKTTLVDSLLKAGGAFQEHQNVQERVMDSDDQERERGITIYAKNASIRYKDHKINIVDTPGHADFGSEVERVLRTVDATVLLVDAYEGPMPQTKFVLMKSLQLGLPVLVVINKIDKSTARPLEVLDMTFDLFAQLGASDEQLDFPYIFTIARDGIAIRDLDDDKKDIIPFLDFVIENVQPAKADRAPAFRMQPATLSYDTYLGRLAVGRVYEGEVKPGTEVTIIGHDGTKRKGKISKLFTFEGLKRVESKSAVAGDIVAISGLSDIFVGETITTDENAEALPAIRIDPPALAMDFVVNDSPFAGKEGKYVTSRNIRERLYRELETNVGLKVEDTDRPEVFKVYGRGEMHLSVLLEKMRREGYEVQVSQPRVVIKTIDGVKHEPVETGVISVPDEMAGKVISSLSMRKGVMLGMETENSLTTIEFEVPARGLLGYRSEFILITRGEGTIYNSFDRFAPWYGEIEKREVGSMISGETGPAVGYALFNLQERGKLFISPGTEVYEGMIIGEHSHGWDLVVNPLKGKKLTNVRASGSDDAIRLTVPVEITLEKAIEYIQDDEYVEITPDSIRLRKKLLNELDRKRQRRRNES
jgi:GTP-binding protein